MMCTAIAVRGRGGRKWIPGSTVVHGCPRHEVCVCVCFFSWLMQNLGKSEAISYVHVNPREISAWRPAAILVQPNPTISVGSEREVSEVCAYDC
jgi:hypothetical protein